MRLISLAKEDGAVRVQFFGCPLHCGYCTHVRAPRQEYTVQQVLEFIADPKVTEVYLGGAEPALQKKELGELLQRLHRMDRKVTLKTSGTDPAFLRETLGLADRYVLEIKCGLDDVATCSKLSGMSEERAKRYLSSLRETLRVLKGRTVRVWIRVVPGYLTPDMMARIGEDIRETATEVHLYQFLSNTENDAPFDDITEPGPPETEMVEMARRLLAYVPQVTVLGRDFKSEFRANQ
jgi:pyruvate formate lyase activating enzyme